MRVDSPALSGRGSRPSRRNSGWGRSHEEIRDVASWMVPYSERPQFPCPLMIRTRCLDTSSNVTQWMKSKQEKALTPQSIFQKNPQVTNTTRQVACHRLNNSRGKRSSISQDKTRPDSPIPTLQRPCDQSQKWRGTLRFLPQLEMRPSTIAPNPVESREAPPNSTVSLTSQRHPRKLPEVTGTSRGNPGFPAATRERPQQSFFNAS